MSTIPRTTYAPPPRFPSGEPLPEDDDESEKHGPEIVMNITWSFRLSRRDTLLVLKALAGRLKPNSGEVEEARELGDRLTELRAAEGRQALAPLERAVTAMNANKEPK